MPLVFREVRHTAPALTTLATARILLVGPDRALPRFEVDRVSDFPAAIAAMRNFPYDAVLVPASLHQEGDGARFARSIKRPEAPELAEPAWHYRGIPFVILDDGEAAAVWSVERWKLCDTRLVPLASWLETLLP